MSKRWGLLLRALAVVIVLAYPFAVYLGLKVLPPGALGLALAAVALLRISLTPRHAARLGRIPLIVIVAYSMAVMATDSELVLRFYPVVINAVMLILFAATLYSPPPMIERIAQARGMPISPHGKVYLRRLTGVWCAFFVANGSIAAWTAVASTLATWAFYNGFVTYILMAALLAIEVVFRKHYQARVGAESE